MIKVFHATNCKIDKFEIPLNGLHFGTIESAKEAASRKEGRLKYLYQVTLSGEVEDVFDCGHNWKDELMPCERKIYSYTNKYEPSIGKSYVIFNTNFIKSVKLVSFYTENKE